MKIKLPPKTPIEKHPKKSGILFPGTNDFFKPVAQAKLTISNPGDSHEQEADSIADMIMRMPATTNKYSFFEPSPFSVTSIQRKCSDCEEEGKLQMKGEPSAIGGIAAPSIVHNVVSKPGYPLDRGSKDFMESRFGVDFSDVKIHNDETAQHSSAHINARAYTHGNSIVFGPGQYQPDTFEGKKLLAHELAHVVQQKKDTVYRKHLDASTTVSQTRTDGIYDLDFGYDIDISGSQALITLNVKLVPDEGVTADEVRDVQAWTNREFMRIWDHRFMLRDVDDELIPLRVKLNFVKSGAHVEIALHKGNSATRIVTGNRVTIINKTEDQKNWFVESEPIVRAHELGHQLGLFDEYIDPGSPDRVDDASPGVFNDHSIMAAFSSEGEDMADARFRHGETMAGDISYATGIDFKAEWSSTYIVRSGDTMHRLAKRIYGDESKWKEIYELNKANIKNYRLKRGQVLKLPGF